MSIQSIKQRFGVIGNSGRLNRAIDIAIQVAPTDLSVLITGESGTGKETFPQIIHHLSPRKHNSYIAVNCGAIPEGTIDSELFGHEKGAFTGAVDTRKGYFESSDKGTIFLDEVSELPLSSQVRLLRVLESGEFMKVGSSKVIKTDVRVIAATNINVLKAVRDGRFREDLYYRLNTVPIEIPALHDRKEDIILLFKKFAQDFSEKYQMPPIKLDDEAQNLLLNYRWPGNIRQLKNITEQISIIGQSRIITAEEMKLYMPSYDNQQLPAIYKGIDNETFSSEREILYKILFDMKKDMNDMKKVIQKLLNKEETTHSFSDNSDYINSFYASDEFIEKSQATKQYNIKHEESINIQDTEELVEESLSIEVKEIELIKKALEKHKGKRKMAANDLGISERTLYRKIKEYGIE
ncbi:MAG: sigma-54-dependent Fis family transcriptional regulator [Bacteroidales bacterium]|nr:sigma-54-dependent Fis family transcriptional regulator [Bacteroidales bacterium]MBN2757047.1 sigma-54-dependent Fis family transcriptional regulator [Bacteroidales bacterium]